MSLAQRELGEVFRIDKQKQMSNKHIDIVRFDNSKIFIREYLNGNALSNTLTYNSKMSAKIP